MGKIEKQVIIVCRIENNAAAVMGNHMRRIIFPFCTPFPLRKQFFVVQEIRNQRFWNMLFNNANRIQLSVFSVAGAGVNKKAKNAAESFAAAGKRLYVPRSGRWFLPCQRMSAAHS